MSDIRDADYSLQVMRYLQREIGKLSEQLELALSRITSLESLTSMMLATDEAGRIVHHIAPGEDAIVFGADGREVGLAQIEERNARQMMPLETGVDYPLLSTCKCGRQIGKERSDGEWQHVD